MFVGTDSAGKTDYWDAKGGRHYRQMPRFERIRRLELAQDGNRIYRRKLMKGWEQPFNENDVYVHKDFIILGRQMMYWSLMLLFSTTRRMVSANMSATLSCFTLAQR